jgi:heat shock protein HtpX
VVPARGADAVHLVRHGVPAHHQRDLSRPGVRGRRPGRAARWSRRLRRGASARTRVRARVRLLLANEVAPLLSAGRRPPIGEGFRAFIGAEAVDRAATQTLQHELEQRVTDPFDSHPSLSERVAGVHDCPAGDPDDSPPAHTLIDDPLAVERAQAVHLFGEEAGILRPVAWDAVGSEVYLDRARRLVSAHGELLGDATAGTLDDLVDQLGRLAGEVQRREPDLEVEHARDFAAALIADGLLVVLHDHGWAVEAPPAEPVICRRGDERVAPHAVVHELREDRLTGGAWRENAQDLGIAELSLRIAVAR